MAPIKKLNTDIIIVTSEVMIDRDNIYVLNKYTRGAEREGRDGDKKYSIIKVADNGGEEAVDSL